jgi:Zn-dependent metalloprotease
LERFCNDIRTEAVLVVDILTALDVAGHEIGHAVCSNTANLTYQNESGAMNEGFSDIWGACIEFSAAPTKSMVNW